MAIGFYLPETHFPVQIHCPFQLRNSIQPDRTVAIVFGHSYEMSDKRFSDTVALKGWQNIHTLHFRNVVSQIPQPNASNGIYSNLSE